MASELEEQKKLILPYAQRAEEIKKVDPKIAYYCRLFAVDQGLRIERSKRCKEIDDLLGALLKQLERDKPGVVLDKENDKFYCEEFALKVFNRADKVDRAGKADANTALAYYAASVFLDIINQFGELDAELTKQQKYALWRAAEIRKAVREGRQPNPPPVQETFPAAPSIETDSAAGAALSQPPPPSTNDLAWPSYERPSTPSAQPSGTPTSSTSAPAFTSSLGPPPVYPCRFPPGTRVLYYSAAGMALEAGTVGKVNKLELGYKCVVALRDRLVEADESVLCPDVTEGNQLLYVAADGQMLPATVLAASTSTWPAQYLLRLTSTGKEVTADPWHVAATAAATASSREHVGGSLPAASEGLFHSVPHSSLPPPAVPPPAASATPPASSTNPDFTWYPSVDSITAPSASAPTSAPSNMPAQPTAGYPTASSPTPVPTQPAAAYPSTATPDLYSAGAHTSSYQPSVEAMSEAHKQAKYAVSSLAFDDAENAVKYLRKALGLLTGSQQ